MNIPACISTVAAMVCCVCSLSAEPVGKHPANPHYFIFNGKPLIFITTDQHYGAVINLDFDYVAFLNRLQEFGMNLTRIYPGAYVEWEGAYVTGNPLGPAPDRFILPWKKSSVSGAHKLIGGYKYDLSAWNPDYFARLKDFVRQASTRNIVVEIAFFNGMYDDRWMLQPLYHTNNLQGVGTCDFKEYTTLTDRKLVACQKEYVKKIASELYEFDNLIYDISDEPEMQKQDSRAWNSAMLDALISVDKHRHIYGETAHSASPDFTRDKRISWIPTEYISPMEITLDKDYDDNKPIINVETGYYPFWYGSNAVEKTRAEGWYGMLGGLAGFIHLNSEFSTTNPGAAGTGTQSTILPQKRVLMRFMNSLDFIRMAKFNDFTVLDPKAISRGIAEAGKCYVLYVFHGSRRRESWPQGPTDSVFNVDMGWFQDTVDLAVPGGSYKVEWINPATGELINSSNCAAAEGKLTLKTPRYHVDLVLRMTRLADLKASHGMTIGQSCTRPPWLVTPPARF